MHNQHVLWADPISQSAHLVLPPPKEQLVHDVFAEAMLEDASTRQHRSPFDWVVSIGAHFAIVATLLLLPLYFTAGLDTHRLNLTFLAPPPMPAGPPPAPLASAATPRQVRVAAPHVITPGQLIAPTFIPKVIVTSPGNGGAPPEEAFAGVPGGVPGGIPGGVPGGVIGGVFGGAMKIPPPPAAVAAGPKVPVRVGGNVKPPRLLYSPDPEYPSLARMSRLSGVVIIDAVIDDHGEVKGMRVVSGHPLLIQAALNAVSKRKYEPTILDGEPVPIALKVEITFSVS
ncbi:MAG TPA: energy transducer TonB [Verrucomicrobiae bacterium]|jgi:protein TonB|nr:energy transducer TonB [Verrucomicrobiae bacterium]